jgi:hypothetical protein
MTNSQAKVLAIIRARGSMRTAELTTYQYRSLHSLWKDGHVIFETCGECLDCEYRKKSGEPHLQWISCHQTVVRPTNPLSLKQNENKPS